jgi:DNA-3-methyladenine glycosylase II
MFDAALAVRTVAAADPALASMIDKVGPFDRRSPSGNYFASLARSIMFQQLAGRAAAAIHARFVAAIGGEATPEAVLQTSPETLRAAGLSGNKTAAILDLATKFTDGTVQLDDLHTLPDEELITRLSAVRGIGRWTAEMFLMFELQRPDVWPVDDYGVRNGWSLMHNLASTIKPKELQSEGERFHPYRSVVAWYCWQAVAQLRKPMVLPDETPIATRKEKASA